MSDIDFQNGFITGMATRGLTVSKLTIPDGASFIYVGEVLLEILGVFIAIESGEVTT